MKRALLLTALLCALVAVLWQRYPDLLRPLVSGSPAEDLLSRSKPVYQWRDASGAWQVTDRPPPEGNPFEVKRYDLDANILPARPAGEGD
jgi:hypothetical protein